MVEGRCRPIIDKWHLRLLPCIGKVCAQDSTAGWTPPPRVIRLCMQGFHKSDSLGPCKPLKGECIPYTLYLSSLLVHTKCRHLSKFKPTCHRTMCCHYATGPCDSHFKHTQRNICLSCNSQLLCPVCPLDSRGLGPLLSIVPPHRYRMLANKTPVREADHSVAERFSMRRV